MTTDKEALQKIFEAALRQADPEDSPAERPQRAEEPPMRKMYCQTATAVVEPKAVVSRPKRSVQQAYAAYTSPPAEQNLQSQETEDTLTPDLDSTATLDAEAADEIGVHLDEKLAAENRKRKSSLLLTAAAALAVIGGCAVWLIQNPDRLEALQSAAEEVKSAGDVNQMVDSYQESLEKVANRGSQIDLATAAMGASTELKEGEDATMEDEMKSLMGGEGKTTGSRAKVMQAAFGNRPTNTPEN